MPQPPSLRPGLRWSGCNEEQRSSNSPLWSAPLWSRRRSNWLLLRRSLEEISAALLSLSSPLTLWCLHTRGPHIQTAMWPLCFGRDCEIQRLRRPRCEEWDAASRLHVNVIRPGVVHAPDPGIIHGGELPPQIWAGPNSVQTMENGSCPQLFFFFFFVNLVYVLQLKTYFVSCFQ